MFKTTTAGTLSVFRTEGNARSSRSLLLLPAVLALTFLATAWPFRFSLPDTSVASLLVVNWGFSTELDAIRNVLLFLPVGMALAIFPAVPRSPVRSTLTAFGVALLFSYLLEICQGLMPARFPSFADVLANAAGATLGAILVPREDPVWK